MDDVVITIGLQQCFVTMDGCNNLGKKQISCRNKDLPEFLSENVNEVEELGGMRNGFCDKKINLETCYTLDDGAKCFIKGIGYDSNNEEGSESKIVARYDNKENKKFWK
jgi:hypothetical protein